MFFDPTFLSYNNESLLLDLYTQNITWRKRYRLRPIKVLPNRDLRVVPLIKISGLQTPVG